MSANPTDPRHIQIGPFGFTFFPDGDDPGIGRIFWDRDDNAIASVQATRVEWDEFAGAVTEWAP